MLKRKILALILILSLVLTFALPAFAADIYFPRAGQDPAPVLVNLYDNATSTIDVAIYSLTHPRIVKALIDAQKRGIQVRVITDREQAAGKTQKHAVNTLLLAGIPVLINHHSGLMHLKMSIVDGQTVTTGSYNYTASASDRNDEMMIVIQDTDFVAACQAEFNTMWDDGDKFTPLAAE